MIYSGTATGASQVLEFMFSTGIECSCPTINNGRVRIDEMASCKHYDYWREDFALVKELGIETLRYGPPIHKTFLGPNRFDWEFADLTFSELKALKIVPIVDLCHFGVPDWIGDFQNPDFPELFASYAKAFALRFPWVQLYTPVNEMFVCATFSAAKGWWNEQLSSDRAFVTALKHIVKANVLAMHAIIAVRPDAIFIQSESSEYFHPHRPDAVPRADYLNQQRFLPLDLNYGHQVSAETYAFLMENGMSKEEYRFFMNMHLNRHCVLGNDYYGANEHYISSDEIMFSGEIFGYDEITHQYYKRYRLPVMHTETNACEGPEGNEAVRWLWKQWANVFHVRKSGLPILGFTWYSLTDQIDWDTALREQNHRVNPVGLYDLERKPRAVGVAYRQLIEDWTEVLTSHKVLLTIPVTPLWE
jgi:beta-glucosidase/6-phospho-beta-glucosidase/beta-galactosidase